MNLRKAILIFLLFLLSILLFFIVSDYHQKNLYKRFDSNFNTTRSKLGLQNIDQNWTFKNYTWDNWTALGYGNDIFLEKYIALFETNDIPIDVIYKEKTKDSSIIKSKYIALNSNLLFWKNRIASKTDYYEKLNDSCALEILSIQYYFQDDNNNKDYFEANYFLLNKDIYFCGTARLQEREEQRLSGKPYKGNITKKQADSILKNWKIKL